MQKLIKGLHQFKNEIFASQRTLFERLAKGQSPDVLFITCSDSRLNPNLLTQSEPGELFIVRNAGNIIPAYGAVHGGEAASIEFAIAGLGVKHIVVCGHSHCGAMKALLHPEMVTDLPAMSKWLENAEPTRRIMRENYLEGSDEQRLNIAIQENVLAQIENLRTHPTVAARLSRGQLSIHAWVYKFETGDVFSFDPAQEQFMVLSEKAQSASAVVRGRIAKLAART